MPLMLSMASVVGLVIAVVGVVALFGLAGMPSAQVLVAAAALVLLLVDGLDAERNEHARPKADQAHKDAEQPRTAAHVIFNVGLAARATVMACDERRVVRPVLRVAVLLALRRE